MGHDQEQKKQPSQQAQPVRAPDHEEDSSASARVRSSAALKRLGKSGTGAVATVATFNSAGDALTHLAKLLAHDNEQLRQMMPALDVARQNHTGADASPVQQMLDEARAAALAVSTQLRGTAPSLRAALVVRVKQVLHQWDYVQPLFTSAVETCDEENKLRRSTAPGQALRSELGALDAEIKNLGSELSDHLANVRPGGEAPLASGSLETAEDTAIDSDVAAARAALDSIDAGNTDDIAKLNLAAKHLARLPKRAVKRHAVALKKLRADIRKLQANDASLANDVEVAERQLAELGSE